MRQTLVLLAGYPATGKTYLCYQILERFAEFEVVSQDSLKEELWDQYGFNNNNEKLRLEQQAWEKYYRVIEAHLLGGNSVISDYPFSQKQKKRLQELSERYRVQVVTIRLTGDLEVLYERSRTRDLEPSRHLAHLVSHYQKGDLSADRSQADSLVTYEVFMDRCKNRGYDTFTLGYLIEVDATVYDQIDYPGIVAELAAQVED